MFAPEIAKDTRKERLPFMVKDCVPQSELQLGSTPPPK
jgi:hypothetical protein